MPTYQPKVTLEYNVVDSRYYVASIRGNAPTVDFSTGSAGKVARVGIWLTEGDAELLGLAAELTIKRYTS